MVISDAHQWLHSYQPALEAGSQSHTHQALAVQPVPVSLLPLMLLTARHC